MPQNYGLGRGLSSLIPKKNYSTNVNPSEPVQRSASSDDDRKTNFILKGKSIIEVDINQIIPNPQQPRLHFNEEKINELSASIKEHGIIQPLIVTQSGAKFELVAGERRFEASKKAGLTKVPVIVREAGEKEKLELAITENVQRHDLDPVEEGKAYKKLMDEFEMSQDEVAVKMGKSRSAISNKIRLLSLPVEIQKALVSGEISEGHAKAILALSNPEKQRALFEMIKKNGLTVRQVEEKTKEVSVRSHSRVVNVDPNMKELENKLMGIFGTKVKLSKSGRGGKIIIEYYSDEELKGILGRISS
ncbi:MAG: ParB/RepB/Spo0J family partition protein [Parcubacteria group bacterium]|jgi:ParB family chromosome partitioning protein